LETAIERKRSEIKALDSQRGSLQSEVNHLDSAKKGLESRITQLQQALDELTKREQELQAQARVLSTAVQVPLWAAVVRADIEANTITNLTLQLLERLSTDYVDIALPLVAEIRARNSIPADNPIELNDLEGEHRLFAGIANAITLEKSDRILAAEMLLRTWETYLNSLTGAAQ